MPAQIQQWSDFLQCPICCNNFDSNNRKPLTLGCGHTACASCLTKLPNQHCPYDQSVISKNVTLVLPFNTALLQLVSPAGRGAVTFADKDENEESKLDVLSSDERHYYYSIIKSLDQLALYLKPLMAGNTASSHDERGSSPDLPNALVGCLSRPLQRKLIALINCQFLESDGRWRAVRAARSVGERAVTELLLQHQNPQQLSANLWAAVRLRGCQFLGPAMQEEVLKLIVLALEDGSALSRKVLVMFVVQRLEPHFPQASKTSIGHVVQLLYRASCFKVSKREGDSSLMQLKEEFRQYTSLRREHDAQIVQIATEAGLRIAPDQWSSLLYGDTAHKSHMQSIIDKLQTPQSFAQSVQELIIAIQKSGDPGALSHLCQSLNLLSSLDPTPVEVGDTSECSMEGSVTWRELTDVMEGTLTIVRGLTNFLRQFGHKRSSDMAGPNSKYYRYKTSMCRDMNLRGYCPRDTHCTFAHSEEEADRYRQRQKRSTTDESISEVFHERCESPHQLARTGVGGKSPSGGATYHNTEHGHRLPPRLANQRYPHNIPDDVASLCSVNVGGRNVSAAVENIEDMTNTRDALARLHDRRSVLLVELDQHEQRISQLAPSQSPLAPNQMVVMQQAAAAAIAATAQPAPTNATAALLGQHYPNPAYTPPQAAAILGQHYPNPTGQHYPNPTGQPYPNPTGQPYPNPTGQPYPNPAYTPPQAAVAAAAAIAAVQQQQQVAAASAILAAAANNHGVSSGGHPVQIIPITHPYQTTPTSTATPALSHLPSHLVILPPSGQPPPPHDYTNQLFYNPWTTQTVFTNQLMTTSQSITMPPRGDTLMSSSGSNDGISMSQYIGNKGSEALRIAERELHNKLVQRNLMYERDVEDLENIMGKPHTRIEDSTIPFDPPYVSKFGPISRSHLDNNRPARLDSTDTCSTTSPLDVFLDHSSAGSIPVVTVRPSMATCVQQQVPMTQAASNHSTYVVDSSSVNQRNLPHTMQYDNYMTPPVRIHSELRDVDRQIEALQLRDSTERLSRQLEAVQRGIARMEANYAKENNGSLSNGKPNW